MKLLAYRDRINRAATFISEQTGINPSWCVILGSGLGGLGNKLIKPKQSISFSNIPGFPKATVQGHTGKLVFGKWKSKGIVVMEGRFHRYEGHDWPILILPVRVLMKLGVTHFLITNAAGGIRSDLVPGDLMLLTDHINLMGGSPLTGPNLDEFGVRFPAMTNCYDPGLRKDILRVATDKGTQLKQGIYAALSGPTYETNAEIRMLQNLGADAVGMSTVPEVIAIRHAGNTVAAISLITNATGGDNVPTHEEVVEMANIRREALHSIILDLIANHSPKKEIS
ncbi:purine-nucleoside phosphorylase [bacterium]|nr:purine-nucleoside phosphorylase [bacterium]